MGPKVSLIIVNWNGKAFISKCFGSLLRQQYKNIEIIIVDCASTDNSIGFLKKKYGNDKRVKIVSLKTDPGPPAAVNMACRQYARGKYVLILNNDVILPADCVSKLLENVDDGNAVLNPLQLDFKRRFIPWTFHEPWVSPIIFKITRLFMNIGGYSIFYPSTACCFLRKDIILKNPLNEHLFLYEDTEWGWRLFLKNIRLKIVFDTYFLHANAGTVKDTEKIAFVLGRIAIATSFICFSTPVFICVLPLLLLRVISKLIYYLLKLRPKHAFAYLSGFMNFLINIRTFISDKRRVQRGRKVNDLNVISFMLQSNAYSDYLRKNAKDYVKKLFVRPE
jgi:GT2 family glycosyltransferase